MQLRYNEQGLIPVVVQEAATGQVLMLAYMNEEALNRTLTSGQACYFSRTRQCLWIKGETSGHRQWVEAISYDCDADSLLLQVRQDGPACHTGEHSCFHRQLWTAPDAATNPGQLLRELICLLSERKQAAPPDSYTARLFRGGVDRIAKKVAEEAGEVIIAAKNQSQAELTYELADLLFHCLVLMVNQGVPVQAVVQELVSRRGLH